MSRFTMVRISAWTLVVFLFAGSIVEAQTCTTHARYRTWLRVSDVNDGRDTLWFGFDSSGTYGRDPQLCEFELPPPPPQGVFETRWVNIPGREGWEPDTGMGQGFKFDYRRYVSRTHIDTYKVRFQTNSPPGNGYPVTLRWSTSSSPPGLLAICDSARLIDEFGGILINVRMHTIDSARVTNSAIRNLLLILYGQRVGPVQVESIPGGLPTTFALEQNYPNPFNPTTTIRFAVQRRSRIDISVYDLIGRKITTVVAQELAPGYYTAEWDGRSDAGLYVASGLYYVRMSAQSDRGVEFTSVRKMMLMR